MEPRISSISEKTSDFKGKLSDLVTGYECPTDNKSQILEYLEDAVSE
jgi:hypothetical protein